MKIQIFKAELSREICVLEKKISDKSFMFFHVQSIADVKIGGSIWKKKLTCIDLEPSTQGQKHQGQQMSPFKPNNFHSGHFSIFHGPEEISSSED